MIVGWAFSLVTLHKGFGGLEVFCKNSDTRITDDEVRI